MKRIGKKRIWGLAIGIGLLLAGVFFLLKPTVQNKAEEKKEAGILDSIENGYSDITVNVEADDAVDFYDLSDDTSDEIDDSTEIIQSVNGIGILEIESIDLKLPVVEGATKATLKVAAGHVSESAAIGEVGNCIIAGHRKYEYGQMFNRLDECRVGDMILFTSVDGTAYTYQVYGITAIEPGDMSLFDFDDGQKKLTLLTCTPVRKATHRLLIMANLVE